MVIILMCAPNLTVYLGHTRFSITNEIHQLRSRPIMKTIIVLVTCLFLSTPVMAWQGYNIDNGTTIFVSVEKGQEDIKTGNVTYFDYDSGEEKIGYLNMYENNLGLLMDLDTGDLIRVQMEGRN